MKFFLLYILILSGLLVSCKDLSEVPAKSPEPSSPEESLREVGRARANTFPFDRAITDNKGRSIAAKVLGKSQLKIAISKGSGTETEYYIIPLERLVQADQIFFQGIEDGGRYEQVEKMVNKAAQLSGRTARWHLDLTSGLREAEKLDLPVLLTFLINGNESSAELEKSLIYSKEFRDWASTRLVLCMVKLDDPNSNHTTGHNSQKERDEARLFGVTRFRNPTALVMMPRTKNRVYLSPHSLSGTTETAIRAVSDALDDF